MRVVTWNLGYWQHRSRHDAAWSYLRNEIRPDVALLQEIILPQLLEGEYLSFRSVHRNWGTAVYTRNISFEELKVKGYPGHVVAVQLKIPDIRSLRLVAVSIHAPIDKRTHRVFPYLDRIFDEVEEIVAEHMFIVGGDLNTARLAEEVWPGYGHGPFWQRLSNGIFFDCFRKFHDAEQQTIFRPGSKHPFQDDHLFTSQDISDRVESCDVLDNATTRSLSDHLPVIAEINL